MKIGVILLILAVQILLSCGSGSSGNDLQGQYSVNDVNILAKNIDLGESVRVEVFFETKTEFDGVPDGIDVVVRVPPELDYIIGSSELYDGSTDNSDTYSPSIIVPCASGETYLLYTFSDFDLFDHEINGFGNFGLKFEARGRSRTRETFVGASAASVVRFNCEELFVPEEREAVQVS